MRHSSIPEFNTMQHHSMIAEKVRAVSQLRNVTLK